jgi:site-specific DNA recombinase
MTPLYEPRIKGAAYIRYSSSMQDDSFSLEAQLRQIKARTAMESVEIVKVYADPATSAYKNRFRPGIAEMLEDSRKDLFSTLYVHKVDRLARRLEWSLDIVNKLRLQDVTLKAVEQNFDMSTPEGKLMFHLLSSLSEFYSDNLSKETHKGKYERARQGYHNGWVPWGYRSEKVGDHKLAVPEPGLEPIVKQVFERYATGLYYDQDMVSIFTRKYTSDLHPICTTHVHL